VTVFKKRPTYAEALVAYQIEHGWNRMDMSPEQTLRFRAVEKAGGDVRIAKCLTFGRLRYRRGALHDGKR
jgi:hypothetical protein